MIVAILAAVAIPIMRGRIDAAKWSEGKAMMGTIATAIRAYTAECDNDITDLTALEMNKDLGFRDGDLIGTYFDDPLLFSIQSGTYDVQENLLEFVIYAKAGQGINAPADYTLTHEGIWTPSGGI